MAYKDPENQKAASKRHYEMHKAAYLERNKRYRKEIRDYINSIKEETSCTDCHTKYPYYVMDFDHMDAQAKAGIVSYFSKTGRTRAMKEEILKCELVCANCHRIRTHKRLQKTDKIR